MGAFVLPQPSWQLPMGAGRSKQHAQGRLPAPRPACAARRRTSARGRPTGHTTTLPSLNPNPKPTSSSVTWSVSTALNSVATVLTSRTSPSFPFTLRRLQLAGWLAQVV